MASLKNKHPAKGRRKKIILQDLLNFSESSEDEQTALGLHVDADPNVKQSVEKRCIQDGTKENVLKVSALGERADQKSERSETLERKNIDVDSKDKKSKIKDGRDKKSKIKDGRDKKSKIKVCSAAALEKSEGMFADEMKKTVRVNPKAKTSLNLQNMTLADIGISFDFSESSDDEEEKSMQPNKQKGLPQEDSKDNRKRGPVSKPELKAPRKLVGLEKASEGDWKLSVPSEMDSGAFGKDLASPDIIPGSNSKTSAIIKPVCSLDHKHSVDDLCTKLASDCKVKSAMETAAATTDKSKLKPAVTVKPEHWEKLPSTDTERKSEQNNDRPVVQRLPLQHPDVSVIRSARFASTLEVEVSPSEDSLLPLSESTRLDCPESAGPAKQSFGHLLAHQNSPKFQNLAKGFGSSLGDSQNSSYEQLKIVKKEVAAEPRVDTSQAENKNGKSEGLEGTPLLSDFETSENGLQYVTCLATLDNSSMYEAVDVSVQTSFKLCVPASDVGLLPAEGPCDTPCSQNSLTNRGTALADGHLSEQCSRSEDGTETPEHIQGRSETAVGLGSPADFKSNPVPSLAKREENCDDELPDLSPHVGPSRSMECRKETDVANKCDSSKKGAHSVSSHLQEARSKLPSDSNYFSENVDEVSTLSGSLYSSLKTEDQENLASLPGEVHDMQPGGGDLQEEESASSDRAEQWEAGATATACASHKSVSSETSLFPGSSEPRGGLGEDHFPGSSVRRSPRPHAGSSSEDDSDDKLEAFFQKLRTPAQAAKKAVKEDDDLDDFIVDDSDVTDSEEAISDADDDPTESLCTDVLVESVPQTRSASENVSRTRLTQNSTALDVSTSSSEDSDGDDLCDNDDVGGDDIEDDDSLPELTTPRSRGKPTFSLSQTPREASPKWYTPATSLKTKQRRPREEESTESLTSILPPSSTTTKVGGGKVGREGGRGDAWVMPACPPSHAGSRNVTMKPLGFLRSLSSDTPDHCRDHEARRYFVHFKRKQEELSSRLFKLFNFTVFENQMPADLSVVWNKRLLKTAGLCKQKRVNDRYTATIELSTKVCDTAERVRDTLIHEMCHAAVWILSKAKEGHGPHWKYWAGKANRAHPEIPVIRRCHDYSISTKYIYRCVKCGYQIGRHSKSLDTERKVCGKCRGRFQLLSSSRMSGSNGGSLCATPRTPNPFALYVKENYGSVKREAGGLPHKQVMEALSRDFAKTKINFS